MSFVAAFLQEIDCLSDYALGNMGLAESDLVGDEKPLSWMVIDKQPLEGPLCGLSLKVLELAQN